MGGFASSGVIQDQDADIKLLLQLTWYMYVYLEDNRQYLNLDENVVQSSKNLVFENDL